MIIAEVFDRVIKFVTQVEEDQRVPLSQLEIYCVVIPLVLSAKYLEKKLYFYL